MFPAPFGNLNPKPDPAGSDADQKRKMARPVPIGQDDLQPGHGTGSDGMLLGPGHPAFHPPQPPVPAHSPAFLPTGGVPPGARFDPITPFHPLRTGEPDFDELLPPNVPVDEHYRPTRPSHDSPSPSPSPNPDSDPNDPNDPNASTPSFGHPFGAPSSSSGNPPFFM